MTAQSLHERIRTDIEGRILSGAAGPGARIPSELELMDVYGCSRMTVNKALSALSAAGLVVRRKRGGTVVAGRHTESMVLDVPDLPVEIARRGQTYRFQLVDRRIRKPLKGDANETLLAGRGRLISVTGLHIADEAPFAFETRLISLAAVPDAAEADFAIEPPGSWLLRHIPWTEAENRIGAAGAAPEWANLLGVDVGAACLTVERRTWRADEHITIVRQSFVAGRYALTARFGASQPDGAGIGAEA